MSNGIVYLLTGPSHGVRLAVSIWSLRRYCQSPICLYTTQNESHAIGEKLAADLRLNIEHRRIVQVPMSKNSTFLTKLDLLASVPFDTTLYLDADTLVVGDISEFINVEAADEFHATQFSNWQSTGRTMRARIERWRTVEQSRFPSAFYQHLVDDALQPHPAINTGVFAFRRAAQVLCPWYELALIGWNTFICEEVALQILLHRFPHRVWDCRFNCSPIYRSDEKDPRVWHFHGEKHVDRPQCRALWMPAFRECLRQNIGGLREWLPAKDKRLANVLNREGNS